MPIANSATALETVAGYFSDEDSAHSALHALQQAGFTSNQIGLASRDSSTRSSALKSSETGQSKSGEPGVWDKVKSFFENGKEAEPYAGESTGNTFNDGEITYGDYGSQDVHHSLKGLSVPDEHSKYFGHKFGQDEGGIVLTVAAADRADEAKTILKQYGADLGEGAAEYAYPEKTETDAASIADERNIRLYGEVLRVHKDRVSSGDVRLRKEVITEMQTIEVPVTREELVIERVQMGKEVADGEATFNGEEIRIPLSEEVASAEKHAVVREEVHVGKRSVTDVAEVGGEVRHEELKIEDETKTAGEYAKR